ncbi:MAG: hypothetical protein V7641_1771 [Blastocatellia bacterium]
MNRRIRIHIKGRDTFWGQAFHVEWQDQFADRKLLEDGAGYYLADQAWLDDLERVGKQTFCEILRAPDNPQRRDWLNSILPRRK